MGLVLLLLRLVVFLHACGLTYLATVCVSCTKVTGQGLLYYVSGLGNS
jgi:hypothetical protein